MTLASQRLQAAFELGRRDFEEHRGRLIPVYFTTEERDAYDAGYVRGQRDLLSSWAGKNGGAL